MDSQIIIDKDIFAVPSGDIWGIEADRVYMVYAPLNGHISLATRENVAALCDCAQGRNADEASRKALSMFHQIFSPTMLTLLRLPTFTISTTVKVSIL